MIGDIYNPNPETPKVKQKTGTHSTYTTHNTSLSHHTINTTRSYTNTAKQLIEQLPRASIPQNCEYVRTIMMECLNKALMLPDKVEYTIDNCALMLGALEVLKQQELEMGGKSFPIIKEIDKFLNEYETKLYNRIGESSKWSEYKSKALYERDIILENISTPHTSIKPYTKHTLAEKTSQKY